MAFWSIEMLIPATNEFLLVVFGNLQEKVFYYKGIAD